MATKPQRREELTPDANIGFILNHTDHEPIACTHFGCGKHLSLVEQLAGNKCLKHQGIKININHYIKKS